MLFLFHLGGNNKKIFSSLFHSRDKPRNSTAGSAYRFYMGSSTAGKNVTEHSAMQMTAVYSCVRILSEAVAGLPLHLYKYTDTGSAKATNHPLYALLHDGPNPEMTSFMFLETLMTHLLLWGNAYAQIIRNGKGEVVVIYPLMPDRMTVDRDENGMLYYEYQTNSGDAPVNKQSTVRLAPTDVLHIAGLGFDGLGAAGEFLGNAKAVSLLAIEKIKSGDKVISTDPETFETAEKTVLETYIREVNKLVHLTINGEEIITTFDHPFYVRERGFVNACELWVGAQLLDVNNNILVVGNTRLELAKNPVKVYNFQVEDYHTYYVGENGVWVHNANCKLIKNDDGTYDAELSYKEDWTPEQRAEADAKCKALSDADTVKTKVERNDSPSVEYKKAFGKDSIPAGKDIDHTIDLQLGGNPDVKVNGKPLDKSVNRSLGKQIGYLIKDFDYGTIIRKFTMVNRQ